MTIILIMNIAALNVMFLKGDNASTIFIKDIFLFKFFLVLVKYGTNIFRYIFLINKASYSYQN